MSHDVELARALSLIDRAGREARSSTFALEALGEPVTRLTVPDQAEAERITTLGMTLKAEAAKIDARSLPFDVAISFKVATLTAERWSKAADWWWLLQDPSGVGFYGMFGPTPYCGGMYLDSVMKLMAGQSIARLSDADRYLGLVSDLADIVRAFSDRLKGQADRQIVMPAAQLAQARVLVAGLARSAAMRVGRQGDELAGLENPDAFRRLVSERLERGVASAFSELSAYLGGEYGDRCGDQVGLSQYPGGREVYEELVRHHLTLDLTPEAVHQEGLRRMKDIRAAMAQLRQSVAFSGDDAAYVAAIDADPVWRADTNDGVTAFFHRYMDRFRPHMAELFNFTLASPHDVEPLPEALAGSMTFGYYQSPERPGATGKFIFNGANLTRQGLSNLASLNYHELVPGHHLHLASQMENERLPPIRKYSYFNAFTEGWAEYAATLAGEVGGYVEPEEKFGRLRMDAFLTCRLVVDTGMNALGWSLEEARDYMRENAFMSETEIQSETIRYSCDIPGQALAYKLGDTFLLNERSRMKHALGEAFDIRAFHDAVLGPGALPLPLVTESVDRAIAASA